MPGEEALAAQHALLAILEPEMFGAKACAIFFEVAARAENLRALAASKAPGVQLAAVERHVGCAAARVVADNRLPTFRALGREGRRVAFKAERAASFDDVPGARHAERSAARARAPKAFGVHALSFEDQDAATRLERFGADTAAVSKFFGVAARAVDFPGMHQHASSLCSLEQ